jgi:predicted Zn-ribbon and HTH transcriptional regulator
MRCAECGYGWTLFLKNIDDKNKIKTVKCPNCKEDVNLKGNLYLKRLS